MEVIFNTVLSTSVYAAIVGLVILFIKQLLRNMLSAKWQYFIWIILILKLLVPFGPESAYSLFNAVPEISYSSTSNLDRNTVYSDQLNTSTNVIVPKEEAVDIEENPGRAISLRQNLIPYVWAGGMLLMLIWLASSYLSLNRKIQRTSVAPDDRTLRVYKECKAILGVKRNIPILIQEAVGMPSIFGVFKPKILLSPIVVKLSDKELEYILMHELAHYKRKDIFANYLLLVLQMVHWFNPVLWYCFKRIRQDMELATDELVLSKLPHAEHRDYGRALITILEGFSTPKLAPRLLAMADDKKNMEKRIKMIKLAEVFKGKRKVAVIVGVLCIALLSGILLTNGIKEQDTTLAKLSPYNAEELYKYKTPYVGDNSKVANLIGSLPYGEFVKGVSLQTKTEPYGITVEYDFKDAEVQKQFVGDDITKQFYNAAIIYALIDNVDVIEFNVASAKQKHIWKRAAVQKNFKGDLREKAKTIEGLSAFIQNIVFKISVTPERYSLAMSSTPGMQLTALYMGNANAKSVVFTAQSGSLFIWEVPSGKISERKQKLEVPLGSYVYWSPIGNDDKIIPEEQDGIILAALLDKNGKKLAETQVTILNEGGIYYNIKRSDEIVIPLQPEKPQSIDEAISRVIKSKAVSYRTGEVPTEGHIILETEKTDKTIKVYTIASIGNFGFENGIFTVISGSGAIPTVITLSNDDKNKYELLDYKEPQDGGGYTDSIKKMFPFHLHEKALAAHKYSTDLIKQQEAQAAAYLKSIGREAKVSASHVTKVPININVDASNKLFSQFAKYDEFINSCPYWIGTIEQVEGGKRVIYETSQSKTNEGYDLITFKKSDYNGTVIKEMKYQIVGSEPQLLQ